VQESEFEYAPISADLRGITQRAEEYLFKAGIGTSVEFYVVIEFSFFDAKQCCYTSSLDACSAVCQCSCHHHQTECVSTIADGTVDLRNDIIITLNQMGINASMHLMDGCRKGVISFYSSGSLLTADKIQSTKYVITNMALTHGKRATFMPSPVSSQTSTGLYIGHSIYLNDRSIFQCPEHHHLSEFTMNYINGILTNAPYIFAFTNPTTNSYKRINVERSKYVEFRYVLEESVANTPWHKSTPDDLYLVPGFPDSSANPYLSIAVLLLSGVIGLAHKAKLDDLDIGYNKISKHDRGEGSVYSLSQCLAMLNKGREFLKINCVFDDVFINNYIQIKHGELDKVKSDISPAEFALYY
jgi:glutamine synthetase